MDENFYNKIKSITENAKAKINDETYIREEDEEEIKESIKINAKNGYDLINCNNMPIEIIERFCKKYIGFKYILDGKQKMIIWNDPNSPSFRGAKINKSE